VFLLFCLSASFLFLLPFVPRFVPNKIDRLSFASRQNVRGILMFAGGREGKRREDFVQQKRSDQFHLGEL
jgi:hypothetical protein